ncbi:MAG: flagellar motor protein MotB [Desulfatiglandales bacterium]
MLFGRKGLGSSSGQGWQVTYTSFVLIVLSFFIMVSSFISYEESKVTRFVRSFSAVLSIFPGGVKLDKGRQVLLPSPDIVGKDAPLSAVMRDINKIREQSKLGAQAELVEEKKGLVLRLQSSLVFDLGSAELKRDAKIFLRELCPVLRDLENPIRIEGHTDNLPINTREFPSNWELSTMRAVNVLKYLMEECGLDPSRVSAAGYAEFRPISDNSTEEGRARNRRVELTILPKEVRRD